MMARQRLRLEADLGRMHRGGHLSRNRCHGHKIRRARLQFPNACEKRVMFHVEADVAVTQVCLVFMALVSWNGAGERVGRGILYGHFLHQSCAHRIRILFLMQARPLPLRRRPPTSLRCARGCREGLLRRRPRTSLRRRRPAAPNSAWLPAWCHRRTSSPSLRILHLRRGSRRPSHPCPPST